MNPTPTRSQMADCRPDAAGTAWWVQDGIGWITLLRPLAGVSAGRTAATVILTALSYLTRAARLYDLYSPRLPAPFPLYLRINVLHTTVLLNLLPMRTGEAAFPLMMKRHFSERYASSIANLLWLRVADFWILLWLGLLVYAVRGPALLWVPVALGLIVPLLLQPLRARSCRQPWGGRADWQACCVSWSTVCLSSSRDTCACCCGRC